MRKNNQILNFLGRGGAFNPKEGNNSAYIKEEDTLFLIDCGEDTFGRLIKTELITNIKKSLHLYNSSTQRPLFKFKHIALLC